MNITESYIKNHIVSIPEWDLHFRETNDISLIFISGANTCVGQADSVSEFVKSLRIELEWIPYDKVLRWVLPHLDGKHYTAYFYNIGQKFENIKP